MTSLIECLKKIPDKRRNQSKHFQLWEIIFCSIACFLSGGRSYRDIERFTKKKFDELKPLLGLNWKRIPHYTTFQEILVGVDEKDFEDAFRKFSLSLLQDHQPESLAIDGKTLKGSYNNDTEQKPIHLLQVFEPLKKIILAHEEVGDKTNEIPVWQILAKELELKNVVVTMDALHCQKKLLK